MKKKTEQEETVLLPVRLADLGEDMALWRIPLTHLREQDKNARVMEVEMFNRLTENIKKNKNLESLPLCVLERDKATKAETFHLISGHHRTRAARAAGLLEVHSLVYEKKLTKSQIRAKQIAHNSLSGYDDPQVLKQIYLEIVSIDSKLESGLSEFDIKIETQAPRITDIKLELDYELLNILFLPRQTKDFEKILDELEPDAKKFIADKKDFEPMAETMRGIAKLDNIRSVPAILARMIEICQEHIKEEKKKKKTSDKAKK